jgi:CheY-specific phosphatase CheX
VQQEILEVFVEAVRQVFLETDIAIQRVAAVDEAEAEVNVITSVGLTGDLKGIFMISTDSASAAAILRAMTGGVRIPMHYDRMSEIQMAAMGELTNQISGRAMTLLFDRHLRCDITPPAVMAARQLQSLVPDLAVSCSLAISGPFGRLTLFLGLRETPPATLKAAESAPGDAQKGTESAPGDAQKGTESAPGDAQKGTESAPGDAQKGTESAPETRRKN